MGSTGNDSNTNNANDRLQKGGGSFLWSYCNPKALSYVIFNRSFSLNIMLILTNWRQLSVLEVMAQSIPPLLQVGGNGYIVGFPTGTRIPDPPFSSFGPSRDYGMDLCLEVYLWTIHPYFTTFRVDNSLVLLTFVSRSSCRITYIYIKVWNNRQNTKRESSLRLDILQ